MVSRTLRRAVLGAFAAAALAAAPAVADVRPDIAVAVNELPRGLEPADDTGNVDVRVTYSIFDTLIRRDFTVSERNDGNRLVPHLAESWRRLSPTLLEVTLRDGVRFHNGDTLTADDVVFTFSPERMLGRDAPIDAGRVYFPSLERVEKVDARTVRFVLNQPDAVFESRLAGYAAWIVNARSWLEVKARVEREDAARPADQRRKWGEVAMQELRWNPVGTGPYRFAGRRADESVRLEAFDDYFMGRPAAASVTFREVPELAGRIAGLVSGEYDIIVDVTPDQIPDLRARQGIRVQSVVLDNSHVVVFNTQHPLLRDKRVRQALSLAIDRQALVDGLWNGETYTPNGHQLPSFNEMYDAERVGYRHDPGEARRLLREAGYRGETIVFRMIPNYYLNGLEAAQVMQEMWRAVGVPVELQMVENFRAVRTDDVAMYAWSNSYRFPDPTAAINVLWGPRSGIQRTNRYWTAPEEFNRLSEELVSTADIGERRAKFQRMLDIFEDEMPMTILYNPTTAYASKASIRWEPYSLYFMDFRPDVFRVE